MRIFDDAKQSAYALWKNLGPVINPGKKKRSIGISKLSFQGQFTKDPHEIANDINTSVKLVRNNKKLYHK